MPLSEIKIDWRSVRIEAVWEALGGPPLRIRDGKVRAKAFWRNADGLNVSLNLTNNLWHDHVTGDGGRSLELATVVLGSKRAAIEFMASHFGTGPGYTPPTDGERRIKECARLWRQARIREWERIKAAAFVTYEEGTPDRVLHHSRFCAWTTACRELYAAERLEGSDLLKQFADAIESHPRETTEFIHDQQKHEREAEEIAAFIVACISASVAREARYAA